MSIPSRSPARKDASRLPPPSSRLRGPSARPGARAQLTTALADHRSKELERELVAVRRQLGHTVAALDRANRVQIPKLPPARPTKRRKGDLLRVCLGDLHGCRRHPATVAAVLDNLKQLQPDEIVLGGDIVDCGGFLAQHHTLGYVAETDYSYEEDIAAANDFLNRLQEACPRARILYLEGNHERRVETWCITETLRHRRDCDMLRRALAPEFKLKLEERGITYYRLSEFYDGLSVPGVIKRGSVYFFHGITTAKHAAAMTLLRTSGNSVFFHTHRAQSDIQRRVGVGIIGAWNPGCLCDLQPLWQHGAPTDWTHGYAVQFVSTTGRFLHVNVPVIDGRSDFTALLRK